MSGQYNSNGASNWFYRLCLASPTPVTAFVAALRSCSARSRKDRLRPTSFRNTRNNGRHQQTSAINISKSKYRIVDGLLWIWYFGYLKKNMRFTKNGCNSERPHPPWRRTVGRGRNGRLVSSLFSLCHCRFHCFIQYILWWARGWSEDRIIYK